MDSSTCRQPVRPVPFVEDNVFYPVYTGVHMCVDLYLDLQFRSIEQHVFLGQYHSDFITMVQKYNLRSGRVIPPVVLL